MVREQLAVRQRSEKAEARRQLAALDRIRQHRETILAERGGSPLDLDPADLVHTVRQERDEKTPQFIVPMTGFTDPCANC
jgi:hypothetical protein